MGARPLVGEDARGPGTRGRGFAEGQTQLATGNLFPLRSYLFRTLAGAVAVAEPAWLRSLANEFCVLVPACCRSRVAPAPLPLKHEAAAPPAPLRSLLGINVRTGETTAQRMHGNLFPLRTKHRPFPEGSRRSASPRCLLLRVPALRRSCRGGAQGALYATPGAGGPSGDAKCIGWK